MSGRSGEAGSFTLLLLICLLNPCNLNFQTFAHWDSSKFASRLAHLPTHPEPSCALERIGLVASKRSSERFSRSPDENHSGHFWEGSVNYYRFAFGWISLVDLCL